MPKFPALSFQAGQSIRGERCARSDPHRDQFENALLVKPGECPNFADLADVSTHEGFRGCKSVSGSVEKRCLTLVLRDPNNRSPAELIRQKLLTL